MKENKIKKSQLVWDPKIARKLLKMNSEIKFCPFCGKSLEEHCDCRLNFVIDVKPYRGEDGVVVPDRTVFVFENNDKFRADYAKLIEESKAKKESEEPEQLSVDFN